ncbi:MAG: hypothetical protein V3V26_03400 [Candidatus Aenigmarchaeota archaeon]
MSSREKKSDPIEVEKTGMEGRYKSKTSEYLSVEGFGQLIGVPLTEEEVRRAKDDGKLTDLKIKRTPDPDGRILIKYDFEGMLPEDIRAYVMDELGMEND